MVDYFDLIILTKTLAEIFKVQPFSSKYARIKIFIKTKFAGIKHPETTDTIFVFSKGG